MKKIVLATLLVFILQPFPTLSQSSRLLSVKDYFSPTPGNIWVRQYRKDHDAGNYFGLKVLEHFQDDTLVYLLGSGPSDCYGNNEPMHFCFNTFRLRFNSSTIIMQGVADAKGVPFIPVSPWLDISDSTRLISLDSTVTCPAGTFYHCIIDQRGGAWAPGFGPVSENLVYAKVNGVEYGTMPKPEATPKSYTVYDYLPPTPGNIWVTQMSFDRGSHNFFAIQVIQQYESDSTLYDIGSGPSDRYNNNDPMDFSLNWWPIKFVLPNLIYQGVYSGPKQTFYPISPWLDLSDSTKFISLDSTIIRPAGTFHNCIVERDGGVWAPGFGPVSPNLVYAKVNGIEYGKMPKPEAAPKSYTVYDYFPPTPGNIWVTKYQEDHGAGNYWGLKIFKQYQDDSLVYHMGSGPSDPNGIGLPMDFAFTPFTLKFQPSIKILEGVLTSLDSGIPFFPVSTWLDLSDLIDLDSTVTCPCGTFYHCIVDQHGRAFAPGFGPVSEDLVYAKVNGVEYGTMPKPEATPKSYTVYDYFPPTPGNVWIRQNFADSTSPQFFGLKVIKKLSSDTMAYVLSSGPLGCFGDPMSFCGEWFTIKFSPPDTIYSGAFRTEQDPFYPVDIWLDFSDSTDFLSTDSTIICPAGTFHHCLVHSTHGAWAPGFGPVYPNLVYAQVNGVEYGTMPTASAVESDHPQNVPRGNALYPAYPNPFNQSTGISFNLNKPGPARLTIYDIQGRVVRVLLDEQAAAGSHYLTWDGMTDDRMLCPSGVYFVSLQSTEFSQKYALTLVR